MPFVRVEAPLPAIPLTALTAGMEAVIVDPLKPKDTPFRLENTNVPLVRVEAPLPAIPLTALTVG